MWMRSTTLKWSCDVDRSCGSGVSTGYRRRYCGAVGAGGLFLFSFFLFKDSVWKEVMAAARRMPLPPGLDLPHLLCLSGSALVGEPGQPGFGDSSTWGEAPGCSDAEHSVLQPKGRLPCRRLDKLLMHSRGGGLAAAGGPQSRPGSY